MLAAIWGVEFEFRPEHGPAPAGAVALDPRLPRRARQLFPLRAYGDLGDHRPRRRAGRQTERIVGGRVRADPVHALDLPASLRSTSRATDGATSSIWLPDALASTAHYLAKSGWRSGLPWGFEVKLPPGYSGPSGRKARQSMSFWAAKGLTRIDGTPAWGRRRGAAFARGTRRAGLSGDAQFRRRLFVQRRRILHPRRLRALGQARRRLRASSRRGRPTIPASRGLAVGNCRSSSPNVATMLASRMVRSGRKRELRLLTLRTKLG